MSDGKLFGKVKSSELRPELEQALKKSKPQPKLKIILKKIIANVILNNGELAYLFADIVPFMKYDDFELRKLCFHYVVAYAPIAGSMATEAIPFLQRFIKEESSPAIRALAIKTASQVSLKPYVDLTFLVVPLALKDNDPGVKRAACFAVLRLYQYDSKRTIKSGLIDELNDFLYSLSPGLVANALAALSAITEQDPDLNLNLDKRHAFALASNLDKTNEWSQLYILTAFLLYVPQTQDDAIALIEKIIPLLQRESSAIVLGALRAIVYLLNYVKAPHLVFPTLAKRLGLQLALLLSKPAEIQFLVLRNVILLLLSKRGLVSFEVQTFFCSYDDPIYIKDTKLEILYLLANENNVGVVLRELEEYATEVDVAMVRKAIRAIGNLAVKLTSAADQCMDVLMELSSSGIPYVIQECIIIFKNILRRYPRQFTQYIPLFLKYSSIIEEELDLKASLIWILGQYGAQIANSGELLDDLTENFADEVEIVQLILLTAVTKLYIQDAQKGEKLVLRLMKSATEEVDNPDVRERGFMYWRLISSDQPEESGGEFQALSKQIILNSDLTISTNNDSIDPQILEELELNIGTLASIYLKPVQSVFRLSKKKILVNSPALQERVVIEHTCESTDNARDNDPLKSLSSATETNRSRFAAKSPLNFSSGSLFDEENFREPEKKSLARRLTNKAGLISKRPFHN